MRRHATTCELLGIFSALATLFACLPGCGQKTIDSVAPVTNTIQDVNLDVVRPEVERFCGDCHATPQPASFPRDRWLHEVDRGYEFYLQSGRSDLAPPRRSDIVQYFRQQAPEKLELIAAPTVRGVGRFRPAAIAWLSDSQTGVSVSHILKLADASGRLAELAVCDMHSGAVSWLVPGGDQLRVVRTLQFEHPDHICRTDLDADGTPDYLVCDLGSRLAEDHDLGRVIWVRPQESGEGAATRQVVLLDHVGRVSDAQAADFDGDGDVDIVVAVFGWQTTGNLLLLRRDGQERGQPHFTTEILDRRTGAIHVPIADLDRDGRPDFVALFAQEHESVEAFLNQGDGSFQKQTLFRAPDPSYGSSGIDLIDLDGDGDLDVLYTNGDTYDSFYVKPYHGIRWIENRQDAPWQDHLLTTLPGVLRAVAADLDGDGDLDVAACSLISPTATSRQPELKHFSSLIWLEQRDGEFVRHEIEADNCIHAALEVADVNRDGATDIVVGNSGTAGQGEHPPLTVWLNRGAP